MATAASSSLVITPDALLEHSQGHRRVTRRVIDAFPDDQLFSFSIGGMRTFALALEIVGMSVPMVRGVINDKWDWVKLDARSKQDVLRLWDESTEQLKALWPQIPPGRFQEHMVAFGQFPGPGYTLLLYVIDNEIHHRGQGYVYLRALGIEPPAFYDRG
jgi:uncharacterized damage-inducible protein DinB